MDIIILTAIVLAGIALESLVSEGARRRAAYRKRIADQTIE